MSIRTFQREQLLGFYDPNQYLICIGSDVPFIVEDANGKLIPDWTALPLFAHEYWHYLHNVTTASGFKMFALATARLAAFSDTLMVTKDGRSAGGGALDGATRRLLRMHADIERFLDGDPGPDTAGVEDIVTSRIVGMRNDGKRHIHSGNPIECARTVLGAEVDLEDGSFFPTEFALGSLAIEESVAALVESFVDGRSPDDTSAPEFPYRVLERVHAARVGADSTPLTIASLGTLALLCKHPGAALLPVLDAYARERREGRTEAQAVAAAVAATGALREDALRPALAHDIEDIVERHRGRGLVEHGVRHITSTMRRGLNLRRTQPLFEIEWLQRYGPEGGLEALRQHFPPCDVLQEREPAPGIEPRDLLVSLTPSGDIDGKGHTTTDCLRAAQSQTHFVDAHYRPDPSPTFARSVEASAECPYFHACVLPFRTKSPDVCKESPWEHFQPGPGDVCWYGSGVSSTLARVTVTRRAESS